MPDPQSLPCRATTLALGLLLALALPPSQADAQARDVVAGGLLGAAGGGYLALAIVTGEARTGRYLYSPDDVGWRLAAVPAGLLAGAFLGHRNPDRLWQSVEWGALGFTAGSLAGAAVGRWRWGGSEGTWSGAILGGAAGLLVGSVAGAVSWSADDPSPVASLSFRLPVGR